MSSADTRRTGLSRPPARRGRAFTSVRWLSARISSSPITLTDRIIRLSLGELADFSGAKYDGDFSLSLEQAQRRKHEYVAEQIGIGPGAVCWIWAAGGVRC